MTVYIDSWGHLFSDQSVRELWSVAMQPDADKITPQTTRSIGGNNNG